MESIKMNFVTRVVQIRYLEGSVNPVRIHIDLLLLDGTRMIFADISCDKVAIISYEDVRTGKISYSIVTDSKDGTLTHIEGDTIVHPRGFFKSHVESNTDEMKVTRYTMN